MLRRVLLCCVHTVRARGLVLNVISPDCLLISRGWWGVHVLPLFEGLGSREKAVSPFALAKVVFAFHIIY